MSVDMGQVPFVSRTAFNIQFWISPTTPFPLHSRKSFGKPESLSVQFAMGLPRL